MHVTQALGSLEHDLAFSKEEPYRAYEPQFDIEQQDKDLLWLTDHRRRIALVHKPFHQIDFFEFTPGRPRLAKPALPVMYHAPTLLGAKLTMVQWINWNQGRDSDVWELNIEHSDDHVRLDDILLKERKCLFLRQLFKIIIVQ